MPQPLAKIASRFPPVSLDELDRRAALLHRVDNKYVVKRKRLEKLVAALRDSHDVLEINGERAFDYESTYFDTPSYLCFWEQVESREPRFKVRTRYYVDEGSCSFEVKLKPKAHETDKRQMDYRSEDRARITPHARRLVASALEDVRHEPLRDELETVLRTIFKRVTLAARGSAERVTIDGAVRVERADGHAVALDDGHVIIETKSERGRGSADEILARAGVEPVSVSKYRLGIGMLATSDPDPSYARSLMRFFSRVGAAARVA